MYPVTAQGLHSSFPYSCKASKRFLKKNFSLIFVVYGLDGFLHFLPSPPASEKAVAFIGALRDTGYLWQLVKGIEVVSGVLLLTGLYVPLALLLLAPIIVNIFCMHFFLNPTGLPIGIIIVVLELALAWFYRDYFKAALIQNAVIEDAVAAKTKSAIG